MWCMYRARLWPMMSMNSWMYTLSFTRKFYIQRGRGAYPAPDAGAGQPPAVGSASGRRQAEVALGDVVALDLGRAPLDGRHRRMTGRPLDGAIGEGARRAHGEEPLGAGQILEAAGRPLVGLRREQLGHRPLD